jgi:hypothetical protein
VSGQRVRQQGENFTAHVSVLEIPLFIESAGAVRERQRDLFSQNGLLTVNLTLQNQKHQDCLPLWQPFVGRHHCYAGKFPSIDRLRVSLLMPEEDP